MALFTMPDGSAGADPSSLDSYYTDTGAGTDLSTLWGLTGGSIGDAYSYATTPDASAPPASSQTLGQLQSGGSTIDWTSILQGGLTALVAADSINHGLTANGQSLPVYRAPNGMVYPMGSGPAMYPGGALQSGGGGGLLFLLLIGAVIFAVAKE